MPTVENQLRELAHHLDTEFTDVEVDELTPPGVESLVGPPVRLEPKPPRRRPGWVVAVTAAVVTLLLVGGAALLFGSFGQDQSPVITEPPAPTPSGEVSPSPRIEHGMAYDAESNRIIMFGGTSKGELVGDLDDTWSYDLNSNTWIDMNPAPSPPNLPAMAYDAESDRVVLLGGLGGQTWAYDFNTNTWRNMSPVTRPLGGGAMAYDAESDRVVLFLQWTGAPDNETWTYDFNTNTWTKMEPTTRPSPRTHSAMAYDAESDRVILYGGTRPAGDNGETWAYDFNTNTWTNMEPTTRPSPRHSVAMAYDAESDRVVLFGGHLPSRFSDEFSDETWAYDFNTNTWTSMEPPTQPLKLAEHSLAYDAESDRVVLFGGDDPVSFVHSDQTWAYDLNTNTWTDLSPVGQESQ